MESSTTAVFELSASVPTNCEMIGEGVETTCLGIAAVGAVTALTMIARDEYQNAKRANWSNIATELKNDIKTGLKFAMSFAVPTALTYCLVCHQSQRQQMSGYTNILEIIPYCMLFGMGVATYLHV